jgi:hypothetical protein
LVRFVPFYRTSSVDSTTKKQKFFCQCGFARIGVTNNGKGFTFLKLDFFGEAVGLNLKIIDQKLKFLTNHCLILC